MDKLIYERNFNAELLCSHCIKEICDTCAAKMTPHSHFTHFTKVCDDCHARLIANIGNCISHCVPYIEEKLENIRNNDEKMYDEKMYDKRQINELLKTSAEKHNMDEITRIRKNYNVDINYGLFGAVLGGHRDLIDHFISHGANDWLNSLYISAYTGNMDLFHFFWSKVEQMEKYELQHILRQAISGNQLNIVKMTIDRGADPMKGIVEAPPGINREILEYLKTEVIKNFKKNEK